MIRYSCALILVVVSLGICRAQNAVRTVSNFNSSWKFFLGDDDQAKGVSYNDSKWRALDLPHDWSIEGAFSEQNPAKPEGGGLPTGIAWYRKTFTLAASQKLTYITFDGVYRNSEVWINGRYLGKRPNGYISFRYELTPYLKNGSNVIAVRVDNSGQPNSRWYSGSGIYRNVWLTQTNKIAIAEHGVFVSTPKVNSAVANVHSEVRIGHGGREAPRLKVVTSVIDKMGKQVATKTTVVANSIDSVTNVTIDLQVTKPNLWSVSSPYLYKVITKVYAGDQLSDLQTTRLGIRYFKFDAATGFSLNGKPMKILGVCNHHDLGALGAAVNVRAMERQLLILKAMGCNGIRTAHNPPAPELLDLCDKLGFIVMDEAFDMWKKKKNNKDYHLDFAQWHQKDLEDQVKSDRNHPSVFMWSIGNEIREQFDSTGIALTKELVGIVKHLDNTRPVTAALTETNAEKNFIYQAGALDIYALNYNHKLYKDFPKNYPGMSFIASETTSGLQTRGFYDMPSDSIRRWPKDGRTKFTDGNKEWASSSYDNVSAYWGSTHEETWKEAKKYPHVSGLFVWTGFDYLGEPTPYPWPARSSYFGIVDLAGFPKDVYYMYKSEWTNTPVLHVFPHWNHKPGAVVDVWAYYNHADEVELFLNGKSLGAKRKAGDDLHVMWRVPFTAGTLRAVSRKAGKIVLTKEIKTAGKPAKIELIADRTTIKPDGKDLSFVTVNILDANGNLVPDADNMVLFRLSGNATIAGVDNGFQASLESFKAPYREAYRGKCLVILQADKKPGTVKLVASSTGLTSKTLIINVK